MKNYLIILLASSVLLFSGCNGAKKELAKKIINSYSIANKESDKREMARLFPSFDYFDSYPKADKIIVNDLKIDNNLVLATCTLYYQTDLGKQIEQELKFLVNTRDSLIVDVLGYLTNQERRQILERWVWETFKDLKPKPDDMDAALVRNQKTAFNRLDLYEYYAMKAIGDRTAITMNVNQSSYTAYYTTQYSNTRISLSITNKSDFDIEYKYEDPSYDYDYNFSAFMKGRTKMGLSPEGYFLIKSGETLNQSVSIAGEHYYAFDKSKIKITPYLDLVYIDKNIEIVNKYCDEQTKKEITDAYYVNSSRKYDYKINIK